MTAGADMTTRRACAAPVAPQFAAGLMLMLAGLALTLHQLEIVDAGRVFAFWPAPIIALGVVSILRRHDSYGRFWGGFWLVAGTWLLLNSLRIVSVPIWALLWPVVLIAVGTGLIIKTLHRGGVPRPVRSRADHLIAVFGETTRKLENRPFEGAYLTSFVGGCRLDLRQAILAPGAAQAVEVFGMLADVRIIVPPHWDVALDAAPILAEMEDRRLRAATNSPDGAPAPRLFVRGAIVLGEVTVNDA